MTKTAVRVASLAASCTLAAAGFTIAAQGASALPAATACGNASLSLSNTEPQGATGHGSFVLLFKNVSATSCSLTGYPGLDALDGSGHVLAHAQQTLQGFSGGAAAVTTVAVAPGDAASATAEWLNFNPTTTGDCTFSTSVATTPPNTTATVHLPVSVSICELQVHPTVGGSSGSGTPTGVPAGSGGLAATTSSADDQRRIVLGIAGGALVVLGGVALVRRRQTD